MIEYLQVGLSPRYFVEIEMPKLLYLLNDAELPARLRKRPLESTAPMTAPLITGVQTIDFTRPLQEFVYALNQGLVRDRFEDIMDTWWNTGNRMRDCKNYITGGNMDADYPKYPCNLTLAGNTYRAIGGAFPWGGGYGLEIGVMVYRIETVDISLTLPDPFAMPFWLKTHLTIWDAGEVHKFPQRDGEPCFTSPLSFGPAFIEAERVRVVDAPPSPYLYR